MQELRYSTYHAGSFSLRHFTSHRLTADVLDGFREELLSVENSLELKSMIMDDVILPIRKAFSQCIADHNIL